MFINPLNAIDIYKVGHADQYPRYTQFVYSNMTARASHYANVFRNDAEGPVFDERVVVFGIQGFIKEMLIETWNKNFFQQPKEVVLARYKRRVERMINRKVSMKRFEELHDLGYLPLRIKALPEGSLCDIRVPFVTVINTDDRFAWLVNYIETMMSENIWKSMTIATIAWQFRKLFMRYAVRTGVDPSLRSMLVSIQGHDFSARGHGSHEDAAKNCSGHLVSFSGSDTILAVDFIEDYYGKDINEENIDFLAGSVVAGEHSVMCMGGQENEEETIRRIIKDVYPEGIVSVVSDTWNLWRVLTEYVVDLKDDILNRQPDSRGLAKVVFRPDSGDPVKIICGDPDAPVGSPQYKGVIECLWDIFGGTVTSTGHRVLHERVGVIYGDSISLQRAAAILRGLEAKGFASINMVYGIGSFTYQGVTRDTFGVATKATAGIVNGELQEIFKDPITDSGEKKSACGLLRVERENGRLVLHQRQTFDQEAQGLLQTVFMNSKLYNEQGIFEIRNRLLENEEQLIQAETERMAA